MILFRKSLNIALLMQPLQLLVNIIFMLSLIPQKIINKEFNDLNSLTFNLIVFISAILNLFICFFTWWYKNHKNKKLSKEVSEDEEKVTED